MAKTTLKTTCVVIGGGATGIGTLRDLSMRNIHAILVEQGTLANGTSARFHGLLHSGGRYAVNDTASARECIIENKIVRHIAPQAVEETEGFFVLLKADDPNFVEPWLKGCAEAGIETSEVDPKKATLLEPELTPDLVKAFTVPDSCVDGFRLILHNQMSAERYGGKILLHKKVTNILSNNGRIQAVELVDRKSGEQSIIECDCVVNAAGSWSGAIAKLAGLDLAISPDRGTLIVFNHRLSTRVINRLHKSSDGDIFVPHGSITILGTTSQPTNDPGDTRPTRTEILQLLELGTQLFPKLINYRILRSFAGTRPLYTPSAATGRNASRNFHIVDHKQDGLSGFFSVFGGKFTTYRLMAERVCDMVAEYLHVQTTCRTAEEPLLSQPDPKLLEQSKKYFPFPNIHLMANRVGDSLPQVIDVAKKHCDQFGHNPLICECEMVSLAEILTLAHNNPNCTLKDIRIHSRMGMGTCQGTFCTLRTLNALFELESVTMNDPLTEIQHFLQERWRGVRQTLFGVQAQELELTRSIYAGVLNVNEADYANLN
ncbi:MAG: anaerobic glycerol-3-phosphate dehydrogenase subunit A [Desulfovibrio sp.]|nr:anaerobic glycerol-3-phosphate dehydrogenase subunit A [Desulfovibrio sp.]